MTATSDQQLGVAPDDDTPIGYMKRTRDYYAAIGYTTPYRWAHYTSAPFQPLRKPLAESRDEVLFTVDILRYYATEGPALAAESELPISGGHAVLQRLPIGPLLGVMP